MQPKPKSNNALIGIIAIVILAGLVVGTIMLKPADSSSSSNTPGSTGDIKITGPADGPAQTDSTDAASPQGEYKNGTYKGTGSYASPGGSEEIDVTITIVDGTVTDTSVSPQAATRESWGYQEDFASSYKDLVVGKAIDSIQLSKVSGSSLTSRGFNKALEQIKSQAKV